MQNEAIRYKNLQVCSKTPRFWEFFISKKIISMDKKCASPTTKQKWNSARFLKKLESKFIFISFNKLFLFHLFSLLIIFFNLAKFIFWYNSFCTNNYDRPIITSAENKELAKGTWWWSKWHGEFDCEAFFLPSLFALLIKSCSLLFNFMNEQRFT